MTPKRTITLVAMAALFGGAGYVFGVLPAHTQATVTPGALAFPGLTDRLQNAARVEITHAGKTLAIANAKGVWGLPDRASYPVQPMKLRELLTGLTELRLVEPRTSDPEQYARLGVEDPTAASTSADLVRVLDPSGASIAALIVGHRRVRTTGDANETVYVRRPNEPQSWLAEGRLAPEADAQSWIERDIANVAPAQIASATVQRDGPALVFGRVDGKPALQQPADHPKLDDYKVAEVFGAFETLTLTDVKPASEPPGTKIGTASFTTTDGAVIDVTGFSNGTDFWAQFAAHGDTPAGKAAAATLEARVNGWTYQVAGWKEKALLPTMYDLKAEPPPPPPAMPPAKP